MPRRRPPGAGSGLTTTTTTLLAILIVLPTILISTAAQQQHPLEHQRVHGQSSREGQARLDNTVTPPRHGRLSSHDREADARKRRPYTPLLAQNERAVATTVSTAPAASAVRAAPAGNAASSGGLTHPSARSLQDWEVEDFVLLATVDGHIHARDRYTGDEIWELKVGKPMLEVIYSGQNDSNNNNPEDKPFLWIVEPKEDGPLYILSPGPYPVLQKLGMTIKQLAEGMAPYASDDPQDPPVVYTAEKKNYMHVVNAKTGVVTKSFSPSGSMTLDTESCSPQTTEYFNARGHECRGVFNLGQTEYIISIHNKFTGDHMCTIKYSEWSPNNRDRDLQAQYLTTMDDQYIYSRYDGHAVALDHKRPKWQKRPVFERKLPYPVARVFDVARPFEDNNNPEATLVLLPQPPGLAYLEDRATHVWLNTTESGSWYALSEANYPAVTDGAHLALCYTHKDLLAWEGPYHLPDRNGLVGVHLLDYQVEPPSQIRAIAGPTYTEEPVPTYSELPPAEHVKDDSQTVIETKTHQWWIVLATLAALVCGAGAKYGLDRPDQLQVARSLLSRFVRTEKAEPKASALPAVPQAETPPAPEAEDKPALPVVGDATTPEVVPEKLPGSEAETAPEPTPDIVEPKEKKVTFDIPEDEDDLTLSRTTTAEPVPEGEESPELNAANPAPATDGQDPTAPATPVKKKKTHRGKRGGQKGKNKKPKDEDEVDRIVDAAKQLDQTPTLHPDEMTMNGDDMQDVTNIKKIGKLTIDFDRVLGNGSGGTFVFEGKWNEREVAVKRMLPQYFGLAEQEVKLLQESDLHPNVIRYFDDEKDENFLYIAVELCQASLFDLYRDGRPGDELTESQQRLVNEINSDVPRALFQLAQGVNHLHSLRIIHRDIKPQNILIAYPQRNQKKGPRLVISDFGLCKTLPDNVSTLIGTTGNAGTVGWKAPELILQPREMERGSSTGHSRDSSSSSDPVAQGVKRAVDIFSLGCVFFYVLTNGSHPFDDDEGWMQIRELNIKKNKANYTELRLGDDSEEPIHLISWMLSNRPEDRPTAQQVMNHPFFWSAEKRLNFLCDCSDHWEREPRDPPSAHLSALEDYSEDVIGGPIGKRNFLARLDHAFVASLGKQRKYTGDRVLDLLRALRNKKNHYEDMDESVKAKVGPLPHGYLRYWSLKFPRLVMACYECVGLCGLQEEPRFRPYFEGQSY
ncbi:hypothetical protein BS50DRAFT_575150 [Corynespora cassiicola Philippines]|uniref:non-specific serine/threonine protein kinase n=1 Tax=Corynespora cassiicola Philippines TaxID=1448308 RepID=A0A2T2NI68_CORCC|nr:hypothetical protein BS50DRAFT_575150 [Corynespora cassiicola Philippines]